MKVSIAPIAFAVLVGCVEVRDNVPDTSKSTTKIDTGSGALAVSSGRVDSSPASSMPKSLPAIGADSPTMIRGYPMAARVALRSDTVSTLSVIDSTPESRPAVSDLEMLRRELVVPVSGVRPEQLHDSYNEMRGGTRRHEAIDILASRGTQVISAASGRVLKLFNSKAGGLMVYAADSSQRFILMYAHLDAYQPGLVEGQSLRRGQPLGIVGTTGNAPAEVPHLHFAIASSGDVNQWWKGAPVNPYPLLTP